MLKWYGYLGLTLIVLVGLNLYFQLEPFASWYIPIAWYGYIFLIDSIIFKIKGSSIMSNPKSFLLMLIISIPSWSIYEIYNLITQNWIYNEYWTLIIHLFDFTTILPALMETKDLFLALEFFKDKKLKKAFKLSNNNLKLIILAGLIIALIPILIPKYSFFMIWFAAFLILDPINYLRKKESLFSDLSKKKLERFFCLSAAGLVCGFIWEFWNYFALPKWFYNIPFVDFWHVFEMPLLGYLGYIPFTWSMFSTYNFLKKDLQVKRNA